MGKLRHLDTNYLWIQEKVAKGDLNFKKVAGVDNGADLFTKTLSWNEIQSLSEDNTQSWVRISHGSNKFVIDSNYNNTEILADLPEEQASQSIVKVFAARSKAKAKPQRREPVDVPSIIPMNERKWIDIEPRESLRTRFRRK